MKKQKKNVRKRLTKQGKECKNIVCPSCDRVVGQQTDIGGLLSWSIVGGAGLETRINEAPRFKCPCGISIVLLKGSL